MLADLPQQRDVGAKTRTRATANRGLGRDAGGHSNRNVLIARLFGGLGNQLFIYASGRGLAARLGREFLLDVASGFERDPYQRKYRIQAFNVRVAPAQGRDCFAYHGGRFHRAFRIAVNKHRPLHRRTYIREQHIRAEDLDGPLAAPVVYLDGYWQQSSYFERIAPELRRELTLRYPLSPNVAAIERTVLTECSVAVHLRGLPGTSTTGKLVSHLPKLPPAYYQAAVDLVRNRLESPRFVIFSDGADPSWLREICPGAILVPERCPGAQDYEELWLMSRCKHHIIANSTFSWWGAWLQNASGHLVFSPRMERYGQTMNLPPDWMVVDG